MKIVSNVACILVAQAVLTFILIQPAAAQPEAPVTMAAISAEAAVRAPAETEHLYRPTPWPLRDNSLTIHAVGADGEEVAYMPRELDPISFSMQCRQEGGSRTACGSQARAQIINFLSGKTLACKKQGEQIVACHVEGKDFSEWLVRSGIAVPKEIDARHAEAIEEARSARRGLWSDLRMRSQNGRQQNKSHAG